MNTSPSLQLISQLREQLTPSERSVAAALFLTDLQERCHTAAQANGWWEHRDQITKLCEVHSPELGKAARALITIANAGLICSEAGELMDFARKDSPLDDHLPEFPGEAVETADVIVRALDMAGKKGWPLGRIILAKIECNERRGKRHGGKIA